MSRREIKTQIITDTLNDDDLYPDVQPWMRDRSAANWNIHGHTWGGIHPQDFDKLKKSQKPVDGKAKPLKG